MSEAQEHSNDFVVHDNLAQIAAFYETYYLIGIGFMVSYSCGFESKESAKKINAMKMKVKTEFFIEDLIDCCLEFSDKEAILEALKKKATKKALKDILAKDKEILNPEIFRAIMEEYIENQKVFTNYMESMFKSSFVFRVKEWDKKINGELINTLIERLAVQSLDK